MSEKNYGSQTYGGIGFSSLLGIVFVVLKLLGKVDWSWGWVLAPFWIPPVLILIIVIIVLFVHAWRKR